MLTTVIRPEIQSLGTIAEHNAAVVPDGEAVIDGSRRITWSQLHERTSRLAGSLLDYFGCEVGDRVAFLGQNCLEGFELWHATARSGLLFVPLNERFAPTELDAIVQSIQPKVLVHTERYDATAADLVARRDVRRFRLSSDSNAYETLITRAAPVPVYREVAASDDLSSICFTSGTTGRPKGVMMRHSAQLAFARAEVEIEQLGPDSRHLFARQFAVAPGHRIIAWHGILSATTVLMNKFNTGDFFRAVEKERITNVLLAPTTLRMLLDNGNPEGRRLDSLRCITYGGAPMKPELLALVQQFFPCDLMQGYGGSEGGQMSYLSQADHRAGRLDSNGRPVPGVQVEVRALDGTRQIGSPGEVFVRSPQLMAGYWRDPEASERVLQDGWYATGDLGREDSDGYIQIVGRVRDMIISGGYNVVPSEVEDVIRSHLAVHDVAVCGVPHETWGEMIIAAVVAKPGHQISAEEVTAHCRAMLAAFKTPRRVIVLDEIPMTPMGKPDRQLLIRLVTNTDRASRSQ